jgi:hypothetical protein
VRLFIFGDIALKTLRLNQFLSVRQALKNIKHIFIKQFVHLEAFQIHVRVCAHFCVLKVMTWSKVEEFPE